MSFMHFEYRFYDFVFNSSTDRQFTLMLELLMKLLFPRGASKGAVFIKQFEVSVFKYNCYQLILPLMFLYCCAVEVKI